MPSGSVIEFDEHRGLGTIAADDGSTYLFHLVEIADGSRSIQHGQRVVFDELPRLGRVQAGRIRKV